MSSSAVSNPGPSAIGAQLLIIWTALAGFTTQQLVIFGLLSAPSASELGFGHIDTAGLLWLNQALALLLLLPALLLALRSVQPGPRAVGTALSWAASLLLGLNLIRQLMPLDAVNSPALARIGLALLFSVPVLIRAAGQPGRLGNLGLAIALASLLALPSLAWGAAGSGLDSVRALAESLGLGLMAAALLALLRPQLRGQAGRAGIEIWTAGATLSAGLVVLAGGWGQDDQNLLLLLALPILGFPAAALARPASEAGRSGWLSGGVLIGLAALPLLALFDPREQIILALLTGETASYAFLAGLSAAGLGLLLGLLATPLAARTERWAQISGLLLALLLLPVLSIPTLAGRGGGYGDQLFVILNTQADLSAATSLSDINERRRFVYTTLTEHARREQAELRELLDARGIAYTPYYLINAIEVRGDALLRLELEARIDVDRVLLSPELRPLPGEPLPLQIAAEAPDETTWGVALLNAPQVWESYDIRGAGVVIGLSDSGVDWQHPALREQYLGSANAHDYTWLDPWNGSPEPYDLNGHGTHTLGSILGNTGIGVAPEARWIGCANLVRGLGNPAYYLDCMQFLLAPYPHGADPFSAGRPEAAADIGNNSWGCPQFEGCDARALEPALQALRAAGIFMVVSAGNEGPVCDSLSAPPAIYDEVLSVGAIDRRGELSSFSSRGPQSSLPEERLGPDLLAPGVDVVSAWPGGGYSLASGTSMAGPHVAGVVALIWSANPALRGDIERTTEILLASARPYAGSLPACSTGELPDPATGFGIVDAYAAVTLALNEK